LLRKINPEKKISVTTPTGAELAKLFTNIYRYVNFALANEFAVRAERYGEDAHEVIRIANNGYSRSHIPIPGFAGGPCLSKDGLLLDNNTTFSSMISAAWKLNEAVPQHVAESILDELGSLYGVKVGLLGLAFKSESDDLRLSPSVKLGEILTAYGAKVQIHDPFVKETLSLKDALRDVEVVILATNHRSFQEIASLIDNSGCRMVYDVWGMFEPKQFLKAKYRRFGRA
jgi:UDP-N-acetyl-D-mannosaminuronic acid dehydrogenase